MNRPRRRFIAGAVCPECGAVDRVILHADQRTECTACGLVKEPPAAPATAPALEPRTRLNPGRTIAEEAAQSVRIITPDGPRKKDGAG